MKYAEYVITGWAITGALLLAYWLRLVRRIRHAESMDQVGDTDA